MNKDLIPNDCLVTQEIIPQPEFIRFNNKDGSLVLFISKDGNVTLGEGVELTEASKSFYDELSKYIKGWGL